MYYLKKLIHIIFFIFIFNQNSFAQNSIAYIDLDLLLKRSELGSKIFNDLDTKKNDEMQKIDNKENEIKKLENEIKNKQNVLTKTEFKKEVDILKKEINEFKMFKNQIQKDFEKIKKEKISEFFKKVNPLIQDYLDKNSIDILLNNKYVVMGKNNLDITEKIIVIINDKLN